MYGFSKEWRVTRFRNVPHDMGCAPNGGLATCANPSDDPVELPETLVVRRSAVVLVVAPAELRVEGFLLFCDRLVKVPLARSSDLFQTALQALFRRPHSRSIEPSSTSLRNMGKPRKSNVSGAFPIRSAFCKVARPNSTRRVFSGCNVSP
jgi:hypothetical protein